MLHFENALCMFHMNLLFCRCSSVVEHVIGNDGVVSPILTIGTIFEKAPFEVPFALSGLNPTKSDILVPESSNPTKIIGLLNIIKQ